MIKIVEMLYGSHLYGTDTHESDKDYKGILLPTFEQCILNEVFKSINKTTGNSIGKNTKDDVDEEFYSLQYFMKLAAKGEMIVIDMLHAPQDMIIESSDAWIELQANRDKFYTKNLAGYLGYIRKQCAKYGVKGSRIAALAELKFVLKNHDQQDLKLKHIWDALPQGEYCRFVEVPQEERFSLYEFCGKRVQETVTVDYALKIVQAQLDKYGARARQAEANEGIDWKAVSHAFRASEQLKEIYITGDLIYPLKNAELIRDIKLGKLHYKNDKVNEILEENLIEIEALALASKYPEKVNQNWMNQFIINLYK